MNPYAVRVLRDGYHVDASDARCKGFEEPWDEEFDFVTTVCDKAKETCPIWPGQPMVAHWGAPDRRRRRGRTNRFTSSSGRWR